MACEVGRELFFYDFGLSTRMLFEAFRPAYGILILKILFMSFKALN